MKVSMCKIFPPVLFFLLMIPGGMLFAQDIPTRNIEDDSSLRISLLDSWFRETPARVLNKRPEYYTLRGGRQIQVRVETSPQNREEFGIVLARERDGAFTGWAQGSWIITRHRDTGEGTRIRIFLRSDFNTYIQFRPLSGERSLMDVVIYDAFVLRSLPIPVPFERLYVLPVEDVLAMAGDRFPRRFFDIEPAMYQDSRAFVSAVRSRLPELVFADDGAIDENGNYVFIDTLQAQDPEGLMGLNCSGFAKWVVDGILRPVTGTRLPISPLKEPFGDRGSSYTDIWEDLRDPFFGLDWNRNLASAAATVLRSSGQGILEEIEVRSWPFSQLILREPGGSSVMPFQGFSHNAGFSFEGLQALLYALAIDEPGRIYLAAVNNEMGAPVTQENPRGLPRFRQYFHVAVLVPFFTERGVFQVVLFESVEETSFARFRTRYPGQAVNLVRIPIERAFDP